MKQSTKIPKRLVFVVVRQQNIDGDTKKSPKAFKLTSPWFRPVLIGIDADERY